MREDAKQREKLSEGETVRGRVKEINQEKTEKNKHVFPN